VFDRWHYSSNGLEIPFNNLYITEPMNVKLAVEFRAPLSFSEFRESLPTLLQYGNACITRVN
jgi:hypothetical protein